LVAVYVDDASEMQTVMERKMKKPKQYYFKQFTDLLQGTKVYLESELVLLRGGIGLLRIEAREAEERHLCKFDVHLRGRYFFQEQLDDVVVKREKAVHARKHYTAELEKEKTKNMDFKGLQTPYKSSSSSR
jgi:hypothetical protein